MFKQENRLNGSLFVTVKMYNVLWCVLTIVLTKE